MIRRIYIHNFRCLSNFDLSLGGLPSVLLLGKNGAGKSTVGSALELLQSIGRGSSRVGTLVRPRDLASGRAQAPMRFEIEVELGGEVYVYSIAFDFPSQFRELRVLDEKLQVAGRPVFTRELAQVSIAPSSQEAVSFRIDWHLVALSIIQEPSSDNPLTIFKKWLRGIIILRPVPSLFQGTTDGERDDSSLVEPSAMNVGGWFTNMVTTSPQIYSCVRDYLALVMPDFNRIENKSVGQNARKISFYFKKENELQLDIDQLSDGERCFFLYSLVIGARAVNGPLLCFWDEPDNFLAPEEVGHSIMGLRRAFQDAGQLLITSHNPEAIRRFSEDNTFYLERRSHLEPTTHRTVAALRQNDDYEGSFVEALLRGDVGRGGEA